MLCKYMIVYVQESMWVWTYVCNIYIDDDAEMVYMVNG